MSKSDGPKFVTALFSFKGKNNDELCFKKGDLITITQTDDGGWWEGTLNEKTGWFPSNYVKEFRTTESGSTPTKVSPEKSSPDSPIHQTLNRDIVLKDIIDSEHANVAELQGLVGNFLQPLEAANILKKEEYKQLIGNIHEVLETHQRLLANLNSALPQGPEARIGNIFLTLASKIKSIHTNYCNCHPQAVCILDHYRDELNEFMERTGAITPGILVLTTGLSKPFRRLDKYSAMLQELERHTEKNHPDRGDTQRSVSVYREIANRCAAVRKQRELALQILTSGIKGWEGEELNVLGDIIHVGPVILASGVDRRDRYFVLFPSTLLVLSTSARMSSFVYEGKLPLTGITVLAIEQCDDYKNAFEIFGPMIENITVLCPSREERQHWIELLSLHEQSATSTRGSNLGRSPTNVSHVSCRIHPPYARLSRLFRRLVRKRLIHPELLKRLLYFQYICRPDLSLVRMRRRCLVPYIPQPRVSPARPPAPPRMSSTIKLDVRFVLDETGSLGYGTASAGALNRAEASPSPSPSRSLPAVVRAPQPRSRPGLVDHEDAKTWRSIGPRARPRLEPITVASPRSSDSGMADSFRYHSTELGSCYTRLCRSESDNDDQYENQCICTSPFGSTPRQSSPEELLHSGYRLCADSSDADDEDDGNGNVGRDIDLDGDGDGEEDEDEDEDEDKDVDEDDDENEDGDGDGDRDKDKRATEETKMVAEVEAARLTRLRLVERKHASQPPTATVRVKEDRSRRTRRGHKGPDPTDAPRIFKSGLYAHWWLKKMIPMNDQVEQPELETSSSRSGSVANPSD